MVFYFFPNSKYLHHYHFLGHSIKNSPRGTKDAVTNGTYDCLHVFSNHTDNVLALTQHENLLFTGSADNSIKVEEK